MRLAGQMMSMDNATLVLHAFLVDSKIVSGNHLLFLTASRFIFAVFALLCVNGVFASMARDKIIK